MMKIQDLAATIAQNLAILQDLLCLLYVTQLYGSTILNKWEKFVEMTDHILLLITAVIWFICHWQEVQN